MEPIYRIVRREPGTDRVERVDRPRLLSPAEREEARRKREEKRRRPDERPHPGPGAQGPRGGVDYSA